MPLKPFRYREISRMIFPSLSLVLLKTCIIDFYIRAYFFKNRFNFTDKKGFYPFLHNINLRYE